MPIAELRAFERAVTDQRFRGCLEPGAKLSRMRWIQTMLKVSMPHSLQTLFVWRNGELPGSTLFQELLYDDLEGLWSEHCPNATVCEIRFLSSPRLVHLGALPCVENARGRPERARRRAKPTMHIVPFIQIGEVQDEAEGDWCIGVDTSREERVWLYSRKESSLPILAQAPSLSEWFDYLSRKVIDVARARDALAPSIPPPASSETTLRLLETLVDESAIELAQGPKQEALGRKLREALSLHPRQRAISSVLDLLAGDDAVEELYASDHELTFILNRFVVAR